MNISREMRVKTAYNLFVDQQCASNDIKALPPRDRFAAIAQKWKNLSNAEKQVYHQQYEEMREAAERLEDEEWSKFQLQEQIRLDKIEQLHRRI